MLYKTPQKKNEIICNIAASHPREEKRVPTLDSKLLFSLPTFTKPKHAFIGLAQYGPSLEEKKKLKIPNVQRLMRKNRLLLLEKNPSSHKKKVDLRVKIYIYTETVMAYSYMKLTLWIFCFYASLSHQRFHCKAGPLFLSSSSMSQDVPGFICVYIYISISFISNYNTSEIYCCSLTCFW